MKHRNRWLSRYISRVAVLVAIAVLAGLPAAAMADANRDFDIISVSSRPDIVSGGNVLVRIKLPSDVPSDDVIVILNSQTVTSAFRPEASGHSLLGLVTGLTLGKNILIAKVMDQENRASLSARLTLTNYPIAGPIFSGPHEEPF